MALIDLVPLSVAKVSGEHPFVCPLFMTETVGRILLIRMGLLLDASPW